MPKPEALWFVRYVLHDKDEDSGRRVGVFQAAMPIPDRFAISSRPHRKAQAINWLKEAQSSTWLRCERW